MVISVRFDEEVENRLAALSKLTGRTMSYYIREAVIETLEDMEDIYIAEKRLENPRRTVSMTELERELGLGD
ncbi:MAG: ribbon-helix-helix protein, CopG family [Phaeodactylibacter sp.]|nr:ribbon-helix-helix protein, CopG family [Phaeodactylibacter sp.]